MLSTELLSHYRRLSQHCFTVVDVETTGSHSYSDRITEISVLQASLSGGLQHQKTDLINPQTTIPSKIVQVTGITQDMVDAAPMAADVLPDYLPWLRSGILTAHNLEFDYPFLRAEYTRLGMAFLRPEHEQLCTVQLARLMLPDLRSRSLPYLVKHFQFNVEESHRARADALACWLLAERLFTELLNESDEVLLSRFVRQWLPLREAAKLLGCSPQMGGAKLATAGVPSRTVGRGSNSTVMYRRAEVEQLYYTTQVGQQLSFESNL
jgi:DNA polymerase-3 subunit epsilon